MTDLDDDTTTYRITGLGLHHLGVLDEESLVHVQYLEHRIAELEEVVDEYDAIITYLVTQVHYIADADSIEQARDLADAAIINIEQVPQ